LSASPFRPLYPLIPTRDFPFSQPPAIFPLYRCTQEPSPPRSIPVCFSEVPVLKRPGRKASLQEHQAYRAAQKKRLSSQYALQKVKTLRRAFDQAGAQDKTLLIALDGSFCNSVFFGERLDRVELLCRCRKDARLCLAAPKGSQRFYAAQTFTPEEVRQDESQPWQEAEVYHGG